MSTLAIAQKQNQAKQSESPHFSQPEISALEPGYVNAFGPNFRSTNGSGPGAGLLQKKTKGIEAVSGSTPMSRPAHDFSSIPVHAKAPVGLQAKLTINTPGDKYEQEADQVADRVMRMPDMPPVQQKYPGGENEKKPQLKSIGNGSAGMESPSIVKDVINSGGQPLDRGIRNFLEPRFGHDFSDVKIHTGNQAADSSRAINAHAYTLNNNIVFNSGKYSPKTVDGKRLLAHELTHVVQQSGGNRSPNAQAMQSGFGALEIQTENRSILIQSKSPLGIQCEPMDEFRTSAPSKDKVNYAGIIAAQGTPLKKSVEQTHWKSEDEKQSFIHDYIEFTKKNGLTQQYKDAIAAYPDGDKTLSLPKATLVSPSWLPKMPSPKLPEKDRQPLNVPMGGTYDDYKLDPEYIDNFNSAGYDPHSKTLHLFFSDGGEAILMLPLQNTGGVKFLVFIKKSQLDNPLPQDYKIYPTVQDKNTLPIVAQWLADHSKEMEDSDLLLQAGFGALKARSVPENLWWLALIGPAARIGSRFASMKMRPAFKTVEPEPGEIPLIRASSKGNISPPGQTPVTPPQRQLTQGNTPPITPPQRQLTQGNNPPVTPPQRQLTQGNNPPVTPPQRQLTQGNNPPVTSQQQIANGKSPASKATTSKRIPSYGELQEGPVQKADHPDAEILSEKSAGFDFAEGHKIVSAHTEQKGGLTIVDERIAGGNWIQLKVVKGTTEQHSMDNVNVAMERAENALKGVPKNNLEKVAESPGRKTYETAEEDLKQPRANQFERMKEGHAYRTSYARQPDQITIHLKFENVPSTNQLLLAKLEEAAKRAVESNAYRGDLPPVRVKVSGK